MNNTSDESSSNRKQESQQWQEQLRQLHQSLIEKLESGADPLAEIREKLQQIQTAIEAPEFTQKDYNHAMDLTSEIRARIVVILQNDEAGAYHKQASKALQESNQKASAATSRFKRYAYALQRRQRPPEKEE